MTLLKVILFYLFETLGSFLVFKKTLLYRNVHFSM